MTDRRDLAEVVTDKGSFTLIDPEALSEEDLSQWLEDDKNQTFAKPGDALTLALEIPEKEKVIGFISLMRLQGTCDQAAFSIMVNRSFRNSGYGTEAVVAALNIAFLQLKMRRVAVSCDTRNGSASKMLLRAGLRLEGEFKEDRALKGQHVSTLYFGILARELSA